MGLGCKIHDGGDPVLVQQTPDRVTIADICPNKLMGRLARDTSEILQVARVGQLIDIDDRPETQPLPNTLAMISP
jgi:hypothetical protein